MPPSASTDGAARAEPNGLPLELCRVATEEGDSQVGFPLRAAELNLLEEVRHRQAGAEGLRQEPDRHRRRGRDRADQHRGPWEDLDEVGIKIAPSALRIRKRTDK